MRFPVAKLELHVTDSEGTPLSGAIFTIMDGLNQLVAQLTSGSNGKCSIPVKLHDEDNIGYSDASLTASDVNSQPYDITEIHPPAGHQGRLHMFVSFIL